MVISRSIPRKWTPKNHIFELDHFLAVGAYLNSKPHALLCAVMSTAAEAFACGTQ